MQKEVVSKEVMQELINKLEEIVNNYCWNLEPFSDENINSFFDGTEEEVTYYKSLIVDSIESTSFLWSSKKIAESIAESIIESSKYTNNLIKNMSSIKLKYVTSLPTSDISENTIYILKASDGTSKDTLNLYNATDGWTSIGEFNISLDDYYNKTEIDTKMDLKANKTEVIANDKIAQNLDVVSADTILSTTGLKTELDKIKTTLGTDVDNNKTKIAEHTSQLNAIENNKADKNNPSFTGNIKLNDNDVADIKIFELSSLTFENGWALFADKTYNSKIVKIGKIVHLNLLVTSANPLYNVNVFTLPNELRTGEKIISSSFSKAGVIQTRLHNGVLTFFQTLGLNNISPNDWVAIDLTYVLN